MSARCAGATDVQRASAMRCIWRRLVVKHEDDALRRGRMAASARR